MLQLSIVIALVATGSGVRLLALGYVVAAAVGILIYTVVLLRMLRSQGLLAELRRDTIRLPTREIFAFSIPLLASDLVMVLRTSLTVVLIEVLRSTSEVAEFRAVMPIAIQNLFVATSFRFIFTPGASRLYARGDHKALNDLYWQTAAWIAILSFPLFALCVGFAEPLTVLLFGAQYQGAGIVLSILCVGYYVNGALGFNSLVLRVFGRVRYLVTADLITAAVNIVVAVLLIRQFGAVGAAIATTGTLLVQNAAYQFGLQERRRGWRPSTPATSGPTPRSWSARSWSSRSRSRCIPRSSWASCWSVSSRPWYSRSTATPCRSSTPTRSSGGSG